MANMDLAGFLEGVRALQAQMQDIIDGLEDIANPSLTQEEKTKLLQLRDTYIIWRDTAERLGNYIQTLLDLGYPSFPKLVITPELKEKLLKGLHLEELALSQIEGVAAAVSGTLDWSAPVEKQ